MNANIVGLLRLVDDNPTMLYAAELIEQLQKEKFELVHKMHTLNGLDDLANCTADTVMSENKSLKIENAILQKALEMSCLSISRVVDECECCDIKANCSKGMGTSFGECKETHMGYFIQQAKETLNK
jgi:hypothetical protein